MATKDLINTSEKDCTFSDIKFKVKNYLPLKDKISLIRSIVSGCFIEYEEGIKYYDSIYKELFKVVYITEFYTNVKLPTTTMDDEGKKIRVTDVFKAYDSLMSGLFKEIIKNIPDSEIEFIDEHIDNAIFEKERSIENSGKIEVVIKKFLNSFLEKIPENMDEVIKSTIEELKSEKFLGTLKKVVNITQFNKGK